MVHIETVDLSQFGVTLPADGVGMVIAQPFLMLTDVEPFRWLDDIKAQQLGLIQQTLSVSRLRAHAAPHTHFTIFPEYSVPGMEGVALVDDALTAANWPVNSVVIGGVDALSKEEFAALTQQPGSVFDAVNNGLDRIADGEWVNCCVTWVKDAQGTVRRWLQPKLAPAWPEQNVHHQDMFRGSSVFVFRGFLDNGTYFRFSSLICFDWIARVEARKVWHWILADLGARAAALQSELALSWFFVIQCNPKPSHDTFLSQVGDFFNQVELPQARRERTCLVFANCAGKAAPGRASHYGHTSVIFSPQALFEKNGGRPTFSSGGKRYRGSEMLSPHADLFFREQGACIHSFFQINAGSVTAGAAGRTIALQKAAVFPVLDTRDPRTPGAPVSASVKWLNDELDDLPCLSTSYPDASLAAAAATAHKAILLRLRAMPSQAIERALKIACVEPGSDGADAWSDKESAALRNLVHSLDILAAAQAEPTLNNDLGYATVVVNGQLVDLLVIAGPSHERCMDHAKKFLPTLRRPVIVISRDHDNNPWDKRFGSFLDGARRGNQGEAKITDPAANIRHVGYRALLDIFQECESPEMASGDIDAALA